MWRFSFGLKQLNVLRCLCTLSWRFFVNEWILFACHAHKLGSRLSILHDNPSLAALPRAVSAGWPLTIPQWSVPPWKTCKGFFSGFADLSQPCAPAPCTNLAGLSNNDESYSSPRYSNDIRGTERLCGELTVMPLVSNIRRIDTGRCGSQDAEVEETRREKPNKCRKTDYHRFLPPRIIQREEFDLLVTMTWHQDEGQEQKYRYMYYMRPSTPDGRVFQQSV